MTGPREASQILRLEIGGLNVNSTTVRERIEEALREIATLFVALAPLDVALGGDRPHGITYGLIFVAGGVILFMSVLLAERRRLRG